MSVCSNIWFPANKEQNLYKKRLFCFPFAGGSSIGYRSIESHISNDTEVLTMELAGRGTRINEIPHENFSEILPSIVEAILPLLDIPFSFFGHSMGALIAFELACYLEKHFQKKAEWLFLSGMRAPHVPTFFPKMSSLKDDELLKWIGKLEDLPVNILKSPETLGLFLKIMRADFALYDSIQISPLKDTTIPILAFGGGQDVFASLDAVRQWEKYTKSRFRIEQFQGKHFFFKNFGNELAQTMNIAMKKIELNGSDLSIDQLASIVDQHVKVSITTDLALLERIDQSFEKMQKAVESGDTIYGVTTGFGGMASQMVRSNDAALMQKNMLWTHKAGSGRYLSKKDVRAAMVLRANSHLRGNSSIRRVLIERLITFVNEGVTPCVPELGSIGASGDLVPLTYIAGALIGHEADYQVEMNGEIIPASVALQKLNLHPLTFEPKEALAMLNGTSMMTAIGANCINEAENLLNMALHIQAMLIQGLHGTTLSFDPYLHQIKPHPGQIWVAKKILLLLQDSRLIRQNDGFDRNAKTDLVQDRYSIRCLPQYLGPVFENIWHIKKQIEIEMNSSNDNPLMNPNTGEIFYGGNFLGEYIGIGMDQLRMMICLMVKSIDVQIALLVEKKFNNGLASCLVGNAGNSINMGLKGLQIVGNSILPMIEFYGQSIADRFPTHAEQFNQNINSQGFNSANLSSKSIELFRRYISLSLLFAVQSIDLRSFDRFNSYQGEIFVSPALQKLYRSVREITQCPSNAEKPWLWNDSDHRLDEQMNRLYEDLTSERSKLHKSLHMD